MKVLAKQIMLNDVLYHTGSRYDCNHEVKKIKFKILYLFHKLIKKEKCYIYCKPCEWYGVCPHSHNEYDKENLEMEEK